MQKFTVSVSLVCLLVLGSFSGSIFASGGFGGGVNQAPQGRDRAKFQLGKAVFQKETEILPTADASKKAVQEPRLQYIQNELPGSEQKRTNLLELAGKLTDEQLQALEYYVSIRYNINPQN